MKVHIMRWAVQDWRTSRVRARSARTDDLALRTIYLELLFALHEAGGELPADPEALADDLMLPAEEIARCLPLLAQIARQPGARGGILVEGGVIRNARVSEDLGRTEAWITAQAVAGKASAEARRSKAGTAQPNARTPRPERPPNDRSNVRSGSAEPPFERASNGPRTPSEPAVAVAVAKPVPMPVPLNDPHPSSPAPAGEASGGVEARPSVGDTLPDGAVVLELDERRPVVVAKPPRPARPEATVAAERIVAFATRRLGYRFDRAQRRRVLERLLGGETEAQLLAPYERQLAELEAADGEPEDGPTAPLVTVDEEAEALRLLAPPAEPPPATRLMPSSTVAIVHNTRADTLLPPAAENGGRA